MHFWAFLILAIVLEVLLLYKISDIDDEESAADDEMGVAFLTILLGVIFLVADFLAVVVWLVFNW